MADSMPVVRFESTDGIAHVLLNRPEAANALSLEVLQQLAAVLKDLKNDAETKAVLFMGAGRRVFCAGADLKERAGMTEAQARNTVRLIGTVIEQVASLPMPTIACLEGGAFGGGLELALACDFRLAGEGILMGLTETSLAIIPGAGGTQRLPRLIGMSKAKELIFTARRLDASEALSIGLVDLVAPVDELRQRAFQLAERIAANGPLAIRAAKRAITLGMDTDLSSGLEIERMAYETILSSEDRIEGLRAFAEKRKPTYRGR